MYWAKNHKKEVKFSDLPKGMKAPWDEEEDDEEVQVNFSRTARHYIDRNMRNITRSAGRVLRSRKMRKVPKKFIKWVLTPAALRADGTEHFFWASKDGQSLIKAFRKHLHNVRRYVRTNRTGLRINNKNLKTLIKSKMALIKAFHKAGHSKGARAVELMWKKAMHTKQFGKLAKALMAVCKSKRAQRLSR